VPATGSAGGRGCLRAYIGRYANGYRIAPLALTVADERRSRTSIPSGCASRCNPQPASR
jgi:hypothetical protein